LAELEALKEKVLSLERALKRLKQERDRSAAQARRSTESGKKTQS
jgi:cell division protein FtsB